MSVIVTTSFSQGAIFYAGETVSCTITFTHSPQKSNAATKDSKFSHSRAHSFSTFDLQTAFNNRGQPASIINSRNKNATSEVESSAMSNAPPSRKMSLSSLASSTFSYFTGSTSITTKDSEPIKDPKEWKSYKESILDDVPAETTIDIEDDEETPRSSIDTQSQYTGSRRSSIDSTASSIPLSRQTRSPLHRLSVNSLHRSSSFSTSSYRNYSEHLLWGSAQVIGQFVSDSVLVKSNVFAPLKTRAMYHPFGTSAGGGMLTKRSESSLNRESRTIPVFSTPPSILFVDLTLAPGESVTYSYKLTLPSNLPPTYRGKSIRFNYYLVIGSQRFGNLSSKPFGAQGHVVQIPFRVFNHVTEEGVRPIYDLMNPEIHFRDQAIVEKIDNDTVKKDPDYYPNSRKKDVKKHNQKTVNENNRQDFVNYIDNLLEKSASNEPVHKIMQRENDLYDNEVNEEDSESTAEKHLGKSCRQIISRITNINKKATFDICKNNRRVAQLFLLKSLYRLGEPIQGIVDFEGAVIPTVQISVYLESNEVIDPSIAQRQPSYIARVSKKKHAGHHAFCRNDRRLTFALAVPTSESPEFQTSAMKLQYYLKLEFITTENSSFDLETNKEHTNSISCEEIQASNFDCQIPIHIFGSSNGSSNNIFSGPHMFNVQ